MKATIFSLVVGLFHVIHAAKHGIVLSGKNRMSSTFRRFTPAVQDTEASIMQNMTVASAFSILSGSMQAPPALITSVQTVLISSKNAPSLPHVQMQSKKRLRAVSGELGIRKTMKLLNDMIYESEKKYDLEQARCANYFDKRNAEMEECRGEISAASGAAADCKAKVLSAQGQLSKVSKDLPNLRLHLSQQNQNCEARVNATKKHLARIGTDIATMAQILKMTECNKVLLQTKNLGVLHCQTSCNAKPYVSFQDHGLRQKIDELESSHAHEAVQEMFADFIRGDIQGNTVDFAKLADGIQAQKPVKKAYNKTKLAKKPVPRTLVPGDPCKDKNGGAPSAANKRAAKCTVSDTPSCPKLQNRFLFIQAGMLDARDGLKEELSELEDKCNQQEKLKQLQIDAAETTLQDAQTRLAEATNCESTASEKARLVGDQHGDLVKDAGKMKSLCQNNYLSLMYERCGMRKIRTEVAQLHGLSAQLQDCKVGPWQPGRCSRKCGGGSQLLTRKIMMPSNGGTDCLPLQQNRSCNDSPCPVDCKVGTWSKWSTCSAACGGGVSQRARDVKVHMRHKGKSCGATTESKSCNVHACDNDCKLLQWSKWFPCSKQCDGGTQKRMRFVLKKATGSGKCAAELSPARLQYKKCNYKGCKKAIRAAKPTLQCMSKLDVILVLDGSSDMGPSGWSKTVEAAKLFVSSFQDSKNSRIAVLVFSGPTTWSGVSKCMGEAPGVVDMHVDIDRDCKISWAVRFSSDVAAVTQTVGGLAWPKGGSLTSLALSAADNELQLARKDAKSAVVVITDGRPLSFRRTALASERIKKKAQLMWVPVAKLAPLKYFKKWASQRWQENVVQVSSFSKLAKPETIDHIIASMCDKVDGGVRSQKAIAKIMKKLKRSSR